VVVAEATMITAVAAVSRAEDPTTKTAIKSGASRRRLVVETTMLLFRR